MSLDITMPRFVMHQGVWLIPGLILVLHLCAFMFSTIITGNIEPIVDNDELIEFIIDSGELFIWHIAKTIQLFFIHQAGANQYTLHVTLSVCTLQAVSQPLKDPGSHIVPLGVPFELSCPICRQPLELGQYCTHYQNIKILCCSIEDSLEDHLHQPFRCLRNVHFTKPDNDQRLNLSDQENVPLYPSSPPPPSYHDASPSPSSLQEPIPDQQGQLHIC